MKWALVAFIVAATTFAGYAMGKKYPKRLRLFSDAVRFCDYYTAQISFKNTRVRELVSAFDGGKEFSAVAGFLQSREEGSSGILSVSERKEFCTFFDGLGRGDVVVEQSFVAGYRGIFEAKRGIAAEEKKKYFSLYTKLGLLVGLLIAILII